MWINLNLIQKNLQKPWVNINENYYLVWYAEWDNWLAASTLIITACIKFLALAIFSITRQFLYCSFSLKRKPFIWFAFIWSFEWSFIWSFICTTLHRSIHKLSKVPKITEKTDKFHPKNNIPFVSTLKGNFFTRSIFMRMTDFLLKMHFLSFTFEICSTRSRYCNPNGVKCFEYIRDRETRRLQE